MQHLRNTATTGHHERVLPEDLASEPQHLSRYLFVAHWMPGRSVVEFCSGMGYGANIMFASGAHNVVGIDINPEVVAEATRRYGNEDVKFICSDVTTSLSIPKADMAICFEGIEHVDQPEELLKNMRQSLAQDGMAFVSTPNSGNRPGGHSGNPYHVREYTLQEFRELLSRHFESVEIFFQWDSGDPLDFRWNARTLMKAMVPIRIKHFVRSRLSRQSAHDPNPAIEPSFASSGDGAVSPYGYRPYPVNYLSLLPGLRDAEPSIWIAICRKPRQ